MTLHVPANHFNTLVVVGSNDERIESIKGFDARFFRKSRLFREGALKLAQVTTENMSKAVSERFWKMVKDSVEQEADTYRGEFRSVCKHLCICDRFC